MSLADISSRTAVEAAIREFEKLGREEFLRKYGFAPARSYFLLHRGGRFDSKAIIGAAHAYQFPDLGPLAADSFSGGEATVASKLRSLGFEISRIGFEPRPRLVWAFCANPKRYRVLEAVQHLEIDYWNVGRSDVRRGDRAVIWQTLDSAGHRGIIAFGEVLGDPESRTDENNPYWMNPADGLQRLFRVPVSYAAPERLPLWVEENETGALLRSLSVARSQGGTVFTITPEQWSRLATLVPTTEISPAVIEAREQFRHRTRTRDGQGFGLSGTERKAVEDHAMRRAVAYLKRRWDVVRDVSANCSYDLLCQRAFDELRVEVKGTTTRGAQVVLTQNEVNEAKQIGYALFVVSEIVLNRSDPQAAAASGGIARLFSPWAPEADALQPISYTCDIDINMGTIVSEFTELDVD